MITKYTPGDDILVKMHVDCIKIEGKTGQDIKIVYCLSGKDMNRTPIRMKMSEKDIVGLAPDLIFEKND